MVQATNPDLLGRLASLRAERDRLLAERQKIAGAPVPRDEVLERMREYVQRVGEIGLTTIHDRARSFVSANGAPRPEPFALLGGDVWNVAVALHRLCGPQLLAELEAGLDAVDLSAAIPTAERGKRLARIDSEITAIEKREELVIRQLEDAGADVARRADCDPALVVAEDSELAA